MWIGLATAATRTEAGAGRMPGAFQEQPLEIVPNRRTDRLGPEQAQLLIENPAIHLLGRHVTSQ